MNQFDQRRGLHNGIQFLTHHRFQRCKSIRKETFGKIQPRLALVLMVALWLGRRLGGEMLVVPSPHECISSLLRDKGKQCGMPGFGLCKRGEDIVEMGANGVKQFRQHRLIDLFDQAEKEHEFCADASNRTEPPEGGTQVQGVAEQLEQEIELIVACDGVLTRVVGVFIVLKTLGQMRRAFGVVERVHGFVLLGNSRIGFALQWAAPVQEVSQRMQSITHPSRVLARRVIARHEATATIGGHADAVEVVLAEVVKMGFPGLGRALRGQWHVQHGRALRLNRDQEGLMAGKNLIAQLKHHCVLCHREGRRQSSTVVLEAFTEIPHGIGLVVDVL